jgi:hypothetical protein
MQALIRPRIAVTASIILTHQSYDHERESRSQNDQCIYASDHEAEVNVGHELLSLELGLPTEHRTSPRNCLSCMASSRR